MVRKSAPVRQLAFLEGVFLAAIVLLSGGSEPPLVSVDDMAALEPGVEVLVVGLLAENWLYESGSEGLLLADSSCSNALRVVCTRATKPMPSQYLAIGDEVCVRGEVSKSATGPYLIVTSDGIERLRSSVSALTVGILCENWMMFLDDQVLIRGVLLVDGVTGGWRLGDTYSECSMRLDLESAPPVASGYLVEVEGTMVLDRQLMEFSFMSHSIRAAP